ncbi:MAG: TlpA disulfide reductase family protein [Bacteroidales bacterium]|nr:TlpA disulfide reductase family protein [Bacteroidales bacterium]
MKIALPVALFLASVALVSCQRNSLRIEGNIDNLADGPIYLSVLDSSLSWQKIDTAVVEYGHFLFDKSLVVDQPECFVLSVGNQNLHLFAANDNVIMSGNALRPEDITVRGSHYHDEMHNLMIGIPDMDRLARLHAQIAALGNDVDKKEDLLAEVQSIKDAQVDYLAKQIADKSESPVAPFVLFNSLDLFSFEQVEQFLAAFQQKNPSHKYVQFLTNIVAQKRVLNQALSNVAVGCAAPDFKLLNEFGDTLQLSSLHGSVVMLEFWASWDPDSRKSNQTIVEVYDKFGGKGLEVVGISLDHDKDEWVRAKTEDKLPGWQLIDPDGAVARLYVIRKLPFSLLVDENGIIVSKDNDGKGLFSDIEERLRRK